MDYNFQKYTMDRIQYLGATYDTGTWADWIVIVQACRLRNFFITDFSSRHLML